MFVIFKKKVTVKDSFTNEKRIASIENNNVIRI